VEKRDSFFSPFYIGDLCPLRAGSCAEPDMMKRVLSILLGTVVASLVTVHLLVAAIARPLARLIGFF
jgi:hypothetical protein